MKRLILLFYVLSIVLIGKAGFAQSLPVGSFGLEDYYRREQLAGKLDSSISFTIRPLTSTILQQKHLFYPDTINFGLLKNSSEWTTPGEKISLSLLPFNSQIVYTTHHPYGWNDGAMIPAKGFQAMISGGVYAKYGPLSLQLKPEIVVAGNPAFEGFTKDHYEVIWARYYDYYNNIDLPERFGDGEYDRIFWGQSSIRLTFDPVSFGISTENLWWGPGMRNSLLMSNTAPGFKHLTLNTSKPIETGIGSFEGQLIAGRLEGSGYAPLQEDLHYFNYPLTNPKSKDWRYLSGLVLTWQPKWVPGLFLGITRSSQSYSKDLRGLGDYLPVFLPFKKISADKDLNQRDQLSSMFFRWLWPEEQTEIYFEYGQNDHSLNLREFVMEPEHSRAYIFGLRKLFDLKNKPEEKLMVNLEVTQMQQTSVKTVTQDAGAWYVNNYIRHGYTNRGQMLGAGVGPGGNLQSLEISWVKSLKRIGLQLERYIHNNDFYYYAYIDSGDWRRHWTDLSAAANGEWNYKNLIFNARLQYVKSLNYQWFLFQTDPNEYFINGRNRVNWQLQAGLTYRF